MEEVLTPRERIEAVSSIHKTLKSRNEFFVERCGTGF